MSGLMLHKKLLPRIAIAGLILFSVSIGFVVYRATAFPFTSGPKHMFVLPDPHSSGNHSGACQPYWYVTSPEDHMIENDPQTITVTGNNPCSYWAEIDFELQASGFDLGSSVGMLYLAPGASGSTSWLVTAHRSGKILINAMLSPQTKVGSGLNQNSETLNISVTGILGLNPQMLQSLSYLGTFLGPMLTVPWWYEQWQKHREKKQAEAAQAAASKSRSAKKRDHARSHR